MLLGFAIMTAFVPGIVGIASNTSWAVMWLAMPLMLIDRKIEVNRFHVLGFMFLSYAGISLMWSPHGILAFMQLLALASVFVWGCTLKDLRSVTIGLSLGLGIAFIVAVLQYFQINLVMGDGRITGLYFNPNVYAEITGMILILILTHKLWWFIPVTIPGMLISSRAVVLGLGFALAMYFWSRSKLSSVAVIVGSLALVAKLPVINSYLSNIATFSTEANINTATDIAVVVSVNSVYQRFNIWEDMLSGLTLFGNGIGSFIYVFPEYNKHIDQAKLLVEYAHNDLYQLIFELGIGVVPLVLMVFILLKADNDYKPTFVFFIIIGIFSFPLFMPVTAFMAALVASQLSKSVLGSRSSFDSSGSVLFNRMEISRY